MLLTMTTRTLAEGASIAMAVLGAVAAVAHLRRFSRKLPRAVVRAKQSVARRVVRVLPIVGLPLGIAGLVWAASHTTRVLLVRDGHSVYGDRTFEDRLGRTPLELPVAAGNEEIVPFIGDPCWTVNASSSPIRLVQIEYPTSYAHFVEIESLTVLPGQRASGCVFRYFGPEFAPPDTLQAMGYVGPYDFAIWLTWNVQEKHP